MNAFSIQLGRSLFHRGKAYLTRVVSNIQVSNFPPALPQFHSLLHIFKEYGKNPLTSNWIHASRSSSSETGLPLLFITRSAKLYTLHRKLSSDLTSPSQLPLIMGIMSFPFGLNKYTGSKYHGVFAAKSLNPLNSEAAVCHGIWRIRAWLTKYRRFGRPLKTEPNAQ